MAEKVDWKSILLQSFLVVLGVVLALATNEWVAARHRALQVAAVRQSILDELRENSEATLAAHEYHAETLQALRAFSQAQQEASSRQAATYPDVSTFPKGYIGSADLVQTAWDAANATDVVQGMDFDEVLRLSRIYERQSDYDFQAREAGSLIYSKLFEQGHPGVLRNYKNLQTVLWAFLYSECRLLADYQQASLDLAPDSTGSLPELPEQCRQVQGG